uniref:Uncharacterized protein n=1 Tax=Mus spicilegus TaxID=10103 RepID=A0A8C6MPJ3_MUSSI
MGPIGAVSDLSTGIKLFWSGPSKGLFRRSTMSLRPSLVLLTRLVFMPTEGTVSSLYCKFPPMLDIEPLMMTAAVIFFRKEAMAKPSSPPLEMPRTPTPEPVT